ncbi:MAG: twitching motility protein PilT [Chloroflexi bacterium RBG_16_54_11]|nr:MAG: twitching motility protein PilT [Chloroflexi bacterium RBG_16_54_11]
MNGKYFIDTNIFIYSFDHDQPVKQKKSMELIQEGLGTGIGIISTQVIQEFLNVATRKFTAPMKLEDSKAYLRLVMNPLCQVYPDLALYESGLDLQAETGYSFFDSLILAAAIRGGCDFLYTEDMQDGQAIHSVTIINPFI